VAPQRTIVVVGASLAGLRAAETFRREGYDGRLVLVGAESHLPYDRPPLSKELLAGEWEPDQVALRKQPYDDLDLDLRLGRRATGVDVADRVVELDDGAERLAFDGLVVATGARPRTLPGTPALDGIFLLRTLDDCLAIRERLDRRPRVVVIGAGFIGSEVAATCRGRGLQVTVLEMLATPLERAVGPVVGDACGRLHRDHGVDLRCGVKVAGFEGADRVQRVRLADGSTVDADVVVVGVGVVPETRWLEDSGLALDDGVVCDQTCLAAPGIVAAGDVARWPNPLFDGERMRVEHWTNATEQGVAAARRLLVDDPAAAESFAPVPFVWSDQYDVKIQAVGFPNRAQRLEILESTADGDRFVAAGTRDGRLVGVVAFNAAKRLGWYRRRLPDLPAFEDIKRTVAADEKALGAAVVAA
jgi:NADPH-dependent 2,4-dienoyl-CoA reductase/sulfur reductase-like enzyme